MSTNVLGQVFYFRKRLQRAFNLEEILMNGMTYLKVVFLLAFCALCGAAQATSPTQPVVTTTWVLATDSLAELHKVHLNGDDRVELEALARTATLSILTLTDGSNTVAAASHLDLAEDVCRQLSKTLTAKLRAIERGSAAWRLLTNLGAGIALGGQLTSTVKAGALIAGGAQAWGETYGATDTEYGSGGVRDARTALTVLRAQHRGAAMERLRQLAIIGARTDPEKAVARGQVMRDYQLILLSLVGVCKG